MAKKRSIVSYSKISAELRRLIAQRYPFGFEQFLINVQGTDGSARALFIETDTIDYLVKFSKAELVRLLRSFSSEDEDDTDFSAFMEENRDEGPIDDFVS